MNNDDVMFDLFAHAGWRIFVSDQEHALETLKMNCHLCTSMEKFHFQRGMIQALQNITTFAEMYRRQADSESAIKELYDEEAL